MPLVGINRPLQLLLQIEIDRFSYTDMPEDVPVLLLYYVQRKLYCIGWVKTSINPFEAILLNLSYYKGKEALFQPLGLALSYYFQVQLSGQPILQQSARVYQLTQNLPNKLYIARDPWNRVYRSLYDQICRCSYGLYNGRSGHYTTKCSTISLSQLQVQQEVGTSRTFTRNRQSYKPISPIQAQASRELQAFIRPSYLFRALLVKRRVKRSLSVILLPIVLYRPALYQLAPYRLGLQLSYQAYQASLTTILVLNFQFLFFPIFYLQSAYLSIIIVAYLIGIRPYKPYFSLYLQLFPFLNQQYTLL